MGGKSSPEGICQSSQALCDFHSEWFSFTVAARGSCCRNSQHETRKAVVEDLQRRSFCFHKHRQVFGPAVCNVPALYAVSMPGQRQKRLLKRQLIEEAPTISLTHQTMRNCQLKSDTELAFDQEFSLLLASTQWETLQGSESPLTDRMRKACCQLGWIPRRSKAGAVTRSTAWRRAQTTEAANCCFGFS